MSTDPEVPSKLDVEKPPNTTTTRIPLAISLALGVFCVALDNTMVSTAIPKITDDFHAIGDAGWYASAYLLTNCTFQLVFGRLYSFLPTKWTFLTALAIFEAGSILCGAAPNATALIVGRVVSGIGAGGLFSGSLIIIALTVPLEARSVYLGSLSSMFGLASIVGPILGGAFTEKFAWRMCFSINLPLGFLTFVGVMFFFRVHASRRKEQTVLEMLRKLDLPGIVLFIPTVICLLVALQWGGGTYSWSSGRIIALLVVSGVLAIAFPVEQIFMGEHALIPHRLLTTTRTVPFALMFVFCLGATFFIFVYFLPTWFQVIKDVSAVDSGVHTLAFLMAQVVATIIAGVGVKRIGYYAAFMWLSLVFACVGSGLITTFSVDTPTREWIGFQILYSVGSGFGIQQAILAVQTVVPQVLVAMGSALVMFCQLLGGSIFVSVAESVFDNKLLSKLAADVPGIDAAAVMAAGTTELRNYIPVQYLTTVLADYNDCLVQAFRIGLVMACVMTFGAVGVEWRSVRVGLRAGFSTHVDFPWL